MRHNKNVKCEIWGIDVTKDTCYNETNYGRWI